MKMSKDILLSANDGKYNSFPGMLFTKEKRLITAWRSGDLHVESIPAYIKGAYSDDMGKTWQLKDLLMDETIDARDIRFSQSRTGRIFMTYQVSNAAPKIRYSDDNGDTWNELFDFSTMFEPDTHFGFGKLVEDNQGGLYYGIYQYDVAGTYTQKVVRSYDDGVTWSQPFIVNNETGKYNCEMALTFIPNQSNLSEERNPAISTGEGFLIGVIRPHSGDSFIVTSFDRGGTWTKSDTPLGFTAHGADMIYSEGKLIISYRDAGGSPAVRISDDLGFTWSDALVLSEARGGYSQLAHIGTGVYAVTYYTDEGGFSTLGDEADVFFRFLNIDEMPKVNKIWRFLTDQSVAASSNVLVKRSMRLDRYSKIKLFLKSDAIHKKTIQINWSFDGVTTAFSETLSEEVTDNFNLTLEAKAPFITQIRIYNSDSESSHVFNFRVHLVS